MEEQIDFFLKTARATFEKHMIRWLEELADTSCAHPILDVRLAAMSHLYAIGNDEELPVIDPGKVVSVHGREVNLRRLVNSLTQFVTPDILAEKSVLFWNDDTVEDIRFCVGNGGALVGPSGKRLNDTLNFRVRGRPIHSQKAESLVNAGNFVNRKYASNEREASASERLVHLLNFTRSDWHAAAYKCLCLGDPEDSAKLLASPSKHWRHDGPQKPRAITQRLRHIMA